jgi:hypothetical protein
LPVGPALRSFLLREIFVSASIFHPLEICYSSTLLSQYPLSFEEGVLLSSPSHLFPPIFIFSTSFSSTTFLRGLNPLDSTQAHHNKPVDTHGIHL